VQTLITDIKSYDWYEQCTHRTIIKKETDLGCGSLINIQLTKQYKFILDEHLYIVLTYIVVVP